MILSADAYSPPISNDSSGSASMALVVFPKVNLRRNSFSEMYSFAP